MQLEVIRGEGAALDALLYPPPDKKIMEYVHNNVKSVMENTTRYSNMFVDTIKNIYNRFNDSDILSAGKALLYQSGGHINQNTIYPVQVNNYRDANLIMQRYIMAHPEVNKLYQQNMCNGFENTYLNPEPNTFGEDRYDYQRVMDGILDFDKEGDDGYVMYYINSDEEDELDTMDKLAILDTWNSVDFLLAMGVDPTDTDGNTL